LRLLTWPDTFNFLGWTRLSKIDQVFLSWLHSKVGVCLVWTYYTAGWTRFQIQTQKKKKKHFMLFIISEKRAKWMNDRCNWTAKKTYWKFSNDHSAYLTNNIDRKKEVRAGIWSDRSFLPQILSMGLLYLISRLLWRIFQD
jgi:hypothetical protein